MRKILMVFVVCMLVVSMFLGTSIAAIVLRVNDWGPRRAITEGFIWFGDEVTKRTGGKVTFEYYYSQSLGSSKEQLENIAAGVFHLGQVAPTYAPGKQPLWDGVTVLPLATSSHVSKHKAIMDLSVQPPMMKEMKEWNQKFLFGAQYEPYDIMSKKAINNLNDLKGLKIRAVGLQAKTMDLLSASPVSMPAPEVYMALSKGTIDAVLFPLCSMGGYSLHEASSHFTYFGCGTPTSLFNINLDTWNGLPPEVKQVMLEVAKEVPEQYKVIYDKLRKDWLKKFEAAGVKVSTFPSEERAKAVEIGGVPVWREWAKKADSKGLPASEMLDFLLKKVREYEKQGY